MPARLLRHDRAHDYRFLMRRWRAVASSAELRLEKYSEAGGWDLYCLASRRKKPETPSIYLSAGIHGDEAATTEGLIEWAQANADMLRALNVLIFPCLNPWGLVNNSRRDPDGRDLNRSFHTSAVPQIAARLDFTFMNCSASGPIGAKASSKRRRSTFRPTRGEKLKEELPGPASFAARSRRISCRSGRKRLFSISRKRRASSPSRRLRNSTSTIAWTRNSKSFARR